MRVAVYARVSDDLQKEKQTIESQLAEVRQFAKEQNWSLDEQHIYADDGYSGFYFERPALDRLRDAARDGTPRNVKKKFERPKMVDGVPGYASGAMAAQHRELAGYQQRLAAIDPSGWPVSQQVDHHLVRAEMNGLDFDHRVRKPWAQNPAFYSQIFAAQSDVPAHEGPVIHGWIDLWTYEYPLSEADAAELAARVGTVVPLLEQARGNLVGNARDLWRMGIRSMEQQSADLEDLASQVAGSSDELDAAIVAGPRGHRRIHRLARKRTRAS